MHTQINYMLQCTLLQSLTMDYEEERDGHDEDMDEEVYMTQGNDSQGHDRSHGRRLYR